ncbi:cation diffusion facilitator family transporter [Oecophyllibacter saccharovorans]|uniref:cation diffusion facilitator family transporter n=1 Tax=Oecophyllibacter saccharovorans TaxID=2558360 RepID=UPI00116D9A23|nr:cation diffusion facilitator family transporter [Oecophyllibacter saccharovorans]TPW36493.1 cation transporter [Oecophyllibacter saccharovorans]
MTSRAMNLRLRIARLSILVSLVVLAVKYSAYAVTGSGALLSDAVETLLNVIAAFGTLWAVAWARRPADDDHPYGHGKAEYLWSIIEGTLVILTALVILFIAANDLRHPHPLHTAALGVALNGAAGVINWVWAQILLRSGRRHNSRALMTSGAHVMSDVWASVALVVGVAAIPLTGWLWLDPLLSTAVALNVLWSGFGMVRESMPSLLDAAPDPQEKERVWQTIEAHGAGAIEAHDLRMRKVGGEAFLDFHLVVPEHMQVIEAHEICNRIERALRQQLGRATISIHIEPPHRSKHDLPPAPRPDRPSWRREYRLLTPQLQAPSDRH